MLAYRFRITSDDNEDFLRVIEVLANQTFEDFHNALVQTCAFKEMELASFYLCDNEWHKKREITLMDMNEEQNEGDENSTKKKVLIMKDVQMRQIINDPHQKILYVFDFLKMITLSIELVKIVEADNTLHYPLIIEKQSEIHIHTQVPNEFFTEELISEEDEALDELSEDITDPEAEDDFI